MDLSSDIERLQAFLFEATTQHSWIAGVRGVVIPTMFGCEKNEWKKGEFSFEERHGVIVSSSPRFFDTVTISRRGQEVWRMKCFGRYDETVTPFLRAALMKNYREGSFVGGRGPNHYQDDNHPGLIYENVLLLGSFEKFLGHDKVHAKPHEERSAPSVLGFCNYLGGTVAR